MRVRARMLSKEAIPTIVFFLVEYVVRRKANTMRGSLCHLKKDSRLPRVQCARGFVFPKSPFLPISHRPRRRVFN